MDGPSLHLDNNRQPLKKLPLLVIPTHAGWDHVKLFEAPNRH